MDRLVKRLDVIATKNNQIAADASGLFGIPAYFGSKEYAKRVKARRLIQARTNRLTGLNYNMPKAIVAARMNVAAIVNINAGE